MYSAKVAAQYCSSFPWDLLWRSFWPHFKLRRTLQIDTKAFQAENRSLVLCLLTCVLDDDALLRSSTKLHLARKHTALNWSQSITQFKGWNQRVFQNVLFQNGHKIEDLILFKYYVRTFLLYFFHYLELGHCVELENCWQKEWSRKRLIFRK